MQKAVINAFAHNDYSEGNTPIFDIFADRFEITTYGNLLAWIGKEEFFTGFSKPKNPEIMRVFKDLELVENLGIGVPAITKLYGREIFVFSENATRTSFKYENIESRVEVGEGRVENGKNSVEILKLIKENPNIKFEELSKILNINVKTVQRNINLLREQNIIKRVGSKKIGHWEVL
jgi:predicted HTH transcriptional regulator